MTSVRGVGPRQACDAGSSSPAYASTSVSRTATRPSGVSDSTMQPSSSGATTSAGRA